MERATNKLLNNKDFVDFIHNNFLYINRPSLFKILDQAIKKHTLTSLLERFKLYTPLPLSTPSSTHIIYSYPPVFPIRQVTRLPIRTLSEEF
ncbi:hypothetical protein RIR_jg7607.t1 [Rhizophagus irregularis DAOM 181602=DAOM 197198]|nr:hypothetical protein RhiirB3_447742 [Rhizophagus irregularis]GET64693.1 hypothetical protein RIR_jg7607.t1 [Rhizophagus irregularis DAOM 181602=DAOM 197198]